MFPRPLLVPAVSLALLVSLIPTRPANAQLSALVGNAIRTFVLRARQGEVRVKLPNDIAAGDTISGTVNIEPAGKTENERNTNAKELNGMVIETNNQRLPVSSGAILRLSVPAGVAQPLKINLVDKSGKPVDTVTIPVASAPRTTTSSNFVVPQLGQSGQPIQITGPFDGDASNTKATISGVTVPVIAESPRTAVIEIPGTVVGHTNLNINDNGKSSSENLRALKIDLTAPKTSLRKGESTELHVQVQGLQGITDPIPIQIQNQTPQNIIINGGNTQNVVVQPSQVTSGGTFNWTTPITGTSSGGFNITGSLPPADSAKPTLRETPTPSPVTSSSPTNAPATQTASPTPLPPTTPSNAGVQPATPEPNVYASFADNDSGCCKKLIKDGVLNFQDDKGNSLTIDHDKLKMTVGGKTHEWQFTQDGKPLWIEWMFCRLKDHQIFSQNTQVMAQQIKAGKTNESAQTINISLAGPYRDEKSTRTYYGLQFSAMKAGTNTKEYSVSLSVDEETCKWSVQLIAEDQTASASNGPPGSPRQLFNYLSNSGNLHAANAYTQGAWWNNMYRLGGELQSWYAWLEAHPDADQSEALKDAFKTWSNTLKSALDQMDKSASDSDRQAFSQMRDLLDTDNPSAQRMFDAFLKFQQLWNRFRNGYSPK